MEKAEKVLSEQERNGYRFVRLKLGCIFTFQKAAPREVQYIFIYSFPKDVWPVLEWESILKSDEYRANVLHQGHNYSIFRITKEAVDLQDFYVARLRYARKTLIKKTIIATYMMLSGAYIVLAGELSAVGRFFFTVIFLGGLLELLSYIVGFCKTAKKKCK